MSKPRAVPKAPIKHLHIATFDGELHDLECDTYSKYFEQFKRSVKTVTTKTLFGQTVKKNIVEPEKLLLIMLECTYLLLQKRIYRIKVDGIEGEIFIEYPKTPVKYYRK